MISTKAIGAGLALMAVIGSTVTLPVTPAGATWTPAGGGWVEPSLVELDDTGDAGGLRFDGGGEGHAVLAWSWSNGSSSHWLASVLDPSSGWSSEAIIEQRWPHEGLDVGADAFGGAWVVYEDGTVNVTTVDIWARHYSPAAGWESPLQVSSHQAKGEHSPQIDVGPDGDAMVIWGVVNGSEIALWARPFDPVVGWGPEHEIGSSDYLEGAVVTEASDGTAILVWSSEVNGTHATQAVRYGGGAWDAAIELLPASADHQTVASADVNAAGQVFVIGTTRNLSLSATGIWACRFLPGSGWDPCAQLLPQDRFDAYGLEVAAGPGGDAWAVWSLVAGGETHALGTRFQPSSGWSAPERLEGYYSVNVWLGGVSAASDGTYTLVTTDANLYPRRPLARRWSPEDGWTGPEFLEHIDFAYVGQVQIVAGTNGSTISVFTSPAGNWLSIWTTRYLPPDTAAPPLIVLSPVDRQSVNDTVVWVSGRSETGAAVMANGVQLRVADDGRFEAALAVSRNTSAIVITATDAAGNVATVAVNITVAPAYTFDDAPLRANLSRMEADLGAAEAQLASERHAREQAAASTTATVFAALATGVAGVAVGVYALRRGARGSRRPPQQSQ